MSRSKLVGKTVTMEFVIAGLNVKHVLGVILELLLIDSALLVNWVIHGMERDLEEHLHTGKNGV